MKRPDPLRFFLITTIILIALARLYLGITRYFDVDEFAHLHWAYLISIGKLPYRDVFIYHLPAFQAFLLPLFVLPPGTAVLTGARILMWLVFLANSCIIFGIARRMTGSNAAALMGVLAFMVFPVTFSKSIEIRPDMLMMLLFLLSLAVRDSFFRGFFFSLSFLVYPKLLLAAPAALVLYWHRIRKLPAKKRAADMAKVVLGGTLPALLAVMYLAIHGLIPRAVQAILYDSVAVNAGKQAFSAFLTLSPYPLIYTPGGGISFPWITNTVILATAAAGLAAYLWKKKRFWVPVLLYLLGTIGFLFLFPAPYTQYFIPVSFAASILAGWMIYITISRLSFYGAAGKALGNAVYAASVVALALSFFTQYDAATPVSGSNREQIQVVTDILSISKPNEPVYDMVGSYVFRPDGYVICCHPYMEFAHRLSPPPPSLAESLVRTQTKFLILDRTGQSLWKPAPADLAFLKRSYLPHPTRPKIYTAGVQFTCARSLCRQTDLENVPTSSAANTFILPVDETYHVRVQPQGSSVMIDGRTVSGPIPLDAGTHTLSAPPAVAHIRIQLNR